MASRLLRCGMHHPQRPVGLTRRQFLWRAARYGGAAVMGSMFALDLLAKDRGGFRLAGRAPTGRGRRIIILGGGPAGLATAYELGRLGYECVLLEARNRPGGRVWTVRGGDTETELGLPAQTCRFDEGLFLNAGAMRLSHHHQTTLDYCRAFGIKLVPFPHFNEAAFVHVDGQPRMRLKEFDTDMRGHTAELLAKVVRRGQLDAPLTAEDREKLIEYLRDEGRLTKDLVYPRKGDTSGDPTFLDHPRGYTVSPGADGGPGAATVPLELEALIQAGYASMHPVDHEHNQLGTMLTPAGGMDHVPRAFAERLGPVIRYEAEVRELRRTAEGGVRIHYADGTKGGALTEVTGDFCVCTLPPHLLAKLPGDLAPATLDALRSGHVDKSGKIGLQFKRRFWEEDDDIYGGRSVTNQDIGQIYYPFDGLNTGGKGIVIGAYHFSNTQAFDDLTPAARERLALTQGAKIHPQYPAEFENSFSVEWHRVRHSEAAWMLWEKEDVHAAMMRTLGQPDGPFYFAGDWLTSIVAWQAGAFVSAHKTVAALHLRANA
jgi:monoamine oxidase